MTRYTQNNSKKWTQVGLLILVAGLSLAFLNQTTHSTPLSSHSNQSSPNNLASLSSYDVLPDMVERVSPGVVNISSTTVITTRYWMDPFFRLQGIPQQMKQTSLGSGFIIDEEGYIITNNHVVDRASEVMVTLLDKRQFPARIIGKDEKMDVALIQIRDQNRRVPPHIKPVTLGDSSTVRIAETVVAVGNPLGLQNTVTRGIISAKNRTIGLGPFDNLLQTDASINPGNSGGPLFNVKGEVIGLNSAIESQTGQNIGIGFAIPINEVKSLIPDLKKYGRVPRPWVGFLGERMTPQLQNYYDLPSSKGVLIDNIVEDGPADRAGLQQGDILVSIDGKETLEPNDVEKILSKQKPTGKVTLKILRGPRLKEIQVQLQELPKLDNIPRGII